MASSLAEGLRMWERETLRKPKAYGCGCLRRCASFQPFIHPLLPPLLIHCQQSAGRTPLSHVSI